MARGCVGRGSMRRASAIGWHSKASPALRAPGNFRKSQCMKKREFLRTLGGASLGLLIGERVWAQYEPVPAAELARDDDFWTLLRKQYVLKPDYINLENGYYSMQAQPVLDAFIAQ